ncbi:MAG: hypothetical protein JW909_08965 [Planctomycetes bacterium]|nr:hypothetical protein [Planctomycetota bacterium]
MRNTVLVLVVLAAGCALQPADEAVYFHDAEAVRQEAITDGTNAAANLSDYPLATPGAAPGEPVLPFIYLDHDLRTDAAWQHGSYRPSNEMGREYGEGFSARLSMRAAWRPYPWLYMSVAPEWYYGDNLDNNEPDAETVFHEALIRAAAGNMWIEAGRFPMWWGPGRHGSLLLSDNYRPRDTIRISNPRPVIPKGLFSLLGPCRLSMFVSDLNNGEEAAGRYLGGMRAAFKPTPRSEFALSRTFVFPATATDADLSALCDAVFFAEDAGGIATADQKIAIEYRYDFPGAVPLSVYGQIATDDEAGNRPAQLALLAGAAAYMPWGKDRLRFTAEWTDTGLNGHGADWYAPRYHVDGNCIGHHAGSDSTDFYFELAWVDVCGTERLRFYVDREAHGASLPVTELLVEKGIEITLDKAAPWNIRLRLAGQEYMNAGGTAGAEEKATLFSIAVSRVL